MNAAHGTSTRHPGAELERVAFAIQTCAAGYTAVPTDPKPRTTPIEVPNPTACVLGDGRLTVFPNTDDLEPAQFCSSLALGAQQQ